MSGHSKWAQIKRKKGAIDQKRGKLFTQFAKQIALAARDGGDPAHNIKLAMAIDRAKSYNIPNDTIQRALERGAGAKAGEGFEEQVYEAYGPGGSAFIIKSITDNKNRTVSDLKHVLSLHGGKLAQSGGVRWMFDERGVVEVVVGEKSREDIELVAIDSNALDIAEEEGMVTVYTVPSELHAMQVSLKTAGVEVKDARIEMAPKDVLSLDPESAQKYESLMQELSELDDVDEVYTNVQ